MPNESPKPEGYKLTESDKQLIRGICHPTPFGKPGNIAAVYFDGQMLVDMIFYRRELGEKLRPY